MLPKLQLFVFFYASLAHEYCVTMSTETKVSLDLGNCRGKAPDFFRWVTPIDNRNCH